MNLLSIARRAITGYLNIKFDKEKNSAKAYSKDRRLLT